MRFLVIIKKEMKFHKVHFLQQEKVLNKSYRSKQSDYVFHPPFFTLSQILWDEIRFCFSFTSLLWNCNFIQNSYIGPSGFIFDIQFFLFIPFCCRVTQSCRVLFSISKHWGNLDTLPSAARAIYLTWGEILSWFFFSVIP